MRLRREKSDKDFGDGDQIKFQCTLQLRLILVDTHKDDLHTTWISQRRREISGLATDFFLGAEMTLLYKNISHHFHTKHHHPKRVTKAQNLLSVFQSSVLGAGFRNGWYIINRLNREIKRNSLQSKRLSSSFLKGAKNFWSGHPVGWSRFF